MRRPWATAVDFRRGRLGRLGALISLFGFLFSISTPGLALVNAAGQSLAVNGVLGVYVCHAPGSQRSSLPDDQPTARDECCLVCQVAQLANGAVPPQHFTLPTESAASVRLPVGVHSLRDGETYRHAQARAPPAV